LSFPHVLTDTMIRFGPMSILLLCAALYGIMRGSMLYFIPVNQRANRLLAALLLGLALYTAPYIIGYAGYYDAYPWLSFMPYNLTLAIGPLLYLYVGVMLQTRHEMQKFWLLHFVPVLLQFTYYCVVFVQPLAFKNNWDAQVHVRVIDPLETATLLVSLALYWCLAWRMSRRRLGARSDWIRNFLITMGLAVLSWFGLVIAEHAFSGLSYFQRFPFYAWLAMLIGYLGTEGYREGAVVFGHFRADPSVPAAAAALSQAEQGTRWRAAIIEGKWWRDPELSLVTLAHRLGTNTTALSRALNEGLGMNFSEVINRLRVQAVLSALTKSDADTAVLDIALAEGFNSKASFNRAFKHYTGETPSDYRRRMRSGGVPLQVSAS